MGPQFQLILQFMSNLVVNTLTEADIPGASLGNRDPEALKVAELKLVRIWINNSFIPTI